MNGKAQNTKAGLAALVGAIVTIGGCSVYRSQAGHAGITFQDAPKTTATKPAPVQTTQPMPPTPDEPTIKETLDIKPAVPAPVEEIVVHVTGAVKKPGVIHLPVGSRGMDAVTAAGGLKSDANPNALNLAAKLEDGSQLYFPTLKEEPKSPAQKEYLAGNAPIVVPEKPVENKSPKTASAAKPGKTAASSHSSGGRGGSAKLTNPSQGMININTASADDLQKLPGIGPAMAARILTYRQESHFQTPEDLMQISGIGEKKFAKMKPFVKVK